MKIMNYFNGKYYRGKGDIEYIKLLDIARSMFEPNPEFQDLPMLYTPVWNGLVEGPTWDGWWIQNSYGTTYCALPFYQEPLLTFLQNSQDLWFDQMGDGKRVGYHNWVAPDGCLCDCARPGWIVYKQGDGKIDIHDWGMEFTAAGILMQAELLLISRDRNAITHYLPKLERCANFIETRRDPNNNLFLAGPAANLLAPSYAGYRLSDGTYGYAYLSGLSITYIAALDRVIELEKLFGNLEKAELYAKRRDLAKRGLSLLRDEEGYFIKSLDPDGTKHGVYGSSKHSYFESSPNHDAIAFRVVDDAQAEKIYEKIASIPGLRPYDFIIANYPSLDDMYEEPEGLWEFGRWVNGGHWSTCEARMILGYYWLGKYEDVHRSMKRILEFAYKFRMDNPLTKFGSDVYQLDKPINLTYDAFGVPAAMIRGLFEYIYTADALTLFPHIPPGITNLEQLFPIRFGEKRIYLSIIGNGDITSVFVNKKQWELFDKKSVFLPYKKLSNKAYISITLGSTRTSQSRFPNLVDYIEEIELLSKVDFKSPVTDFNTYWIKLHKFYKGLIKEKFGESYESAHAKIVMNLIKSIHNRKHLLSKGKISSLPNSSRADADRLYAETVNNLFNGLEKVIKSYKNSEESQNRKIYKIWTDK